MRNGFRRTAAEQVLRLRQTQFHQEENADYGFGSG
jgi:hypothetical protein